MGSHQAHDTYGINVLHDGGSNPAVDIIFLPGLASDPNKTWTHKYSKKCWPRDLLPKIMQNARIMNFNYEAKLASFEPTSQSTFDDVAKNMIDAIVEDRQERKMEGNKIIFVAYSFGGLLLLQALLQIRLSSRPEFKRILDCIRGFLFLGVPFNGTQAARLLWLPRLAGISGLNKSISDLLEVDSKPRAISLNNFFSLMEQRNDMVLCVFEEKSTRGINIVPPASGKITGFPSIYFRKNHIDLPTFEDEEDKGFKRLARQFEKWISIGASEDRRTRNPEGSARAGRAREQADLVLEEDWVNSARQRANAVRSVTYNNFYINERVMGPLGSVSINNNSYYHFNHQ